MNAMAIFVMQVVVSSILISFSIGMLATGRGETSVYLPLLSGVTATWLPNPSYPKMPISTTTKSLTIVDSNAPDLTHGTRDTRDTRDDTRDTRDTRDIEMGVVEHI